MLEVGKLYSCSGYFLLLYPDKEAAASGRTAGAAAFAATDPADDAGHAAAASGAAAAWSRELGKPVSYCNPLTPLLILSVKEEYVEVLVGDKRRWIIYRDWLNIKEIVDEAA